MEIPIIVVSLAGLALGGHHFVAAAAAVGRRLGMSPLLVGATIVAIGTSLPEWAISVGAALRGYSDLSVGNVVGSNVCNVALVLGLAAMVTPLAVGRAAVLRDGAVMLAATGLLIAVTADGVITRPEGALLLGLAVLTVLALVATGPSEPEPESAFHWWEVARALGGLALVLVSSHFFVVAAKGLADTMGIPEWLVGVTVAAIGTSLPELVTSLAAAFQGRAGIVVGNVLGSSTMNVFFVLGTAAALRPMQVGQFAVPDAAIFAALMLLPCAFLWTQLRVTRWEGGVLFAVGLAWYVQQVV